MMPKAARLPASASDRSQKSRGGAPRGERPTLLDARRIERKRGNARPMRLRACVIGPRRVPRKHPSACWRTVVTGSCKPRRTRCFASARSIEQQTDEMPFDP